MESSSGVRFIPFVWETVARSLHVSTHSTIPTLCEMVVCECVCVYRIYNLWKFHSRCNNIDLSEAELMFFYGLSTWKRKRTSFNRSKSNLSLRNGHCFSGLRTVGGKSVPCLPATGLRPPHLPPVVAVIYPRADWSFKVLTFLLIY